MESEISMQMGEEKCEKPRNHRFNPLAKEEGRAKPRKSREAQGNQFLSIH
jgi:hypothetical protein